MAAHCTAFRADGRQCEAFAQPSGLCGSHDPDSRALRSDLNRFPARRRRLIDERVALAARRARLDAQIADIDRRIAAADHVHRQWLRT